MKKQLKKKEYLLRMENNTFIEIEKYSRKHDLSIAQVIRKAIKKLIK